MQGATTLKYINGPSKTKEEDANDGKAEGVVEPDTQEDDSLNEREVKFDYKDLCKKLTVKFKTEKAKVKGLKAEIKSLKEELARRYNTEIY